MHRRLFGIAGLAVAVFTFVAVNQAQQRSVSSSQTAQQIWETERAFQLSKILERAKAHASDAEIRVEIGTLAPIDLPATREAVAHLEKMIQVDAARGDRAMAAPAQIGALRIKLAEGLNALDAAEVKFSLGMISPRELNDAYLQLVNLLIN